MAAGSGYDGRTVAGATSRQPSKAMNMKFCPNYGCVAYGRVVYTQSTRCAFCRWDLKPPRMKSETAEEAPTAGPAADSSAVMHPRTQSKRHTLRPSA